MGLSKHLPNDTPKSMRFWVKILAWLGAQQMIAFCKTKVNMHLDRGPFCWRFSTCVKRKNNLENQKMEWCKKFDRKDILALCTVLGIKISWKREMGMLTVCQSRYTQIVIDQFGLESAKGQNPRMDSNAWRTQDAEPSTDPYDEEIGCIMYLIVVTRTYLANSVCKLAKCF